MKAWIRSALSAAVLVAASLSAETPADARVRREGQWPEPEKAVSLDVAGVSRAEALRKLADAAGWSVVVHGPSGESVDVHVKGQPASKVLELLLDDGDYVAKREGTLVSIERAQPAAPATSEKADGAAARTDAADGAAPPAAAVTAKHRGRTGDDDRPRVRAPERTVMGGDVHIGKGEVVREVTVFGGNVEIAGEVTGDVTVFGGNVEVYEGARVRGDATVFGGRLKLDKGSRVDGDVDSMGGSVERDPGAQVGGSVSSTGEGDDDDDDGEPSAKPQSPPETPPTFWGRTLKHVTHGVRLAAVLFVIGTVLLALAGRRMDALRLEMAARPMRSVALGLTGALASALVLIALCVTVIGIPIAIVALLAGVFAVLGAMCAVISVAGEGLLRHKTENPYVHLAVGCALFVVLASIPWVGGIVVAAVVFAGIGVLVGTRAAGFLAKKNGVEARSN
jgi:hypothetical protein